MAADAAKPVDSAKGSDAPKAGDPKALSAAALAAAAASAGSAPAAAPVGKDIAALFQTNNYTLRPTDVINVNVAEDIAATKDYRVSVEGTVSLVYLNDHPLKVSGLTKEEAANLIRKTYVDEKIYQKPSVTVDIREFSVRLVNVLGQVARPGQIQIPAQKAMTLVNAIAAAGGYTEKAATVVTITRVLSDGKFQTFQADLKAAVKDASKDISIQENDTISLGESFLADAWK